jgi:hypothetical protein
VILRAVDDQYRASHARGQGVEPLPTDPQMRKLCQPTCADGGWARHAPAACDVAEVKGAVAAIIREC